MTRDEVERLVDDAINMAHAVEAGSPDAVEEVARAALLAAFDQERAEHVNDVAIGERRLIAREKERDALRKALAGLVAEVEHRVHDPIGRMDGPLSRARAALAASPATPDKEE